MDVIVGSSTGVVKGVDLQNNSCTNLNFSTSLTKQDENVALAWKNSDDAGGGENSQSEFLCALLNRQLKLCDSATPAKFEDLFECTGGDGKICGVEVVGKNILTCVESGLVKLWDFDGNDKMNDINAGANVCRMRKCANSANLFATGGKENPLRIWDLQADYCKKPIFTSKNVRNDWLELRVPIWESDFRFLENPELIASCTGHHFVRLYDRRSQCKRPCVNIDWSDHPFSAMSMTSHDRQVVVGSTRGFMGLFDLRSPGKLVHAYKGFAGSISSVEAHPTHPYVASCGLDRFLRVHHVDTKKMLHKIYCKAHLNTLLLKKDLSIIRHQDQITDDDNSDSEHFSSRKSRDHSPIIESDGDHPDPDGDEIWSKMKSINKNTDKMSKSKKLKEKRKLTDKRDNKMEKNDDVIIDNDQIASKRKCRSSVIKNRSRNDDVIQSSDDVIVAPLKKRKKIAPSNKRKKIKVEDAESSDNDRDNTMEGRVITKKAKFTKNDKKSSKNFDIISLTNDKAKIKLEPEC